MNQSKLYSIYIYTYIHHYLPSSLAPPATPRLSDGTALALPPCSPWRYRRAPPGEPSRPGPMGDVRCIAIEAMREMGRHDIMMV